MRNTFLIILLFVSPLSLAQNCREPLTFSIGKIDSRFEISKQTVETLLQKATYIWNNAGSGKVLKLVPASGQYTIHFIYDGRQIKINKLKSANQTIDKLKENSINLKEQEAQIYEVQNKLKTDSEKYNKQIKEFEEDVEYKNKNNKWDKYSLKEFQERKQKLQATAKSLNERVEHLNNLIRVHNQAINYNKEKGLQTIAEYNQNKGGKFVAGLCNKGTKEIIIYEFESLNRLVYLLAHELGHALGLAHVENSESIMFPENAFNDFKTHLTDEDKKALSKDGKCQ